MYSTLQKFFDEFSEMKNELKRKDEKIESLKKQITFHKNKINRIENICGDTSKESYLECIEIKTTDGRLFFCDGEGTLYEPEEGSDDSARPFAKMIEVKYKASPFHHNDKYYIAAVEIEADGTKYWMCKLANKAYVFDENENGLHDHIGWIKTRNGKQVLKLKGQKKEVKISVVSDE